MIKNSVLLTWALAEVFLFAHTTHAATIQNVIRIGNKPIITPEMVPEEFRKSINGPSPLIAPSWFKKPLGKYYLYFAHHHGTAIHLAYSDHITGPWKIFPGSILQLNSDMPCVKEVAAPDVHADADKKQIRMYFNCMVNKNKVRSFVALSDDGLTFRAEKNLLGRGYLRTFKRNEVHYAVNRIGRFLRSQDGLKDFEEGPNPLSDAVDDPANGIVIRHTGIWRDGDILNVIFSRVGDAPESLMYSQVNLQGDWKTWKASPPIRILKPEKEYEGADLPIKKSVRGAARERLHQLRDPAILIENGMIYLFYSIAGESGIGLASIQYR